MSNYVVIDNNVFFEAESDKYDTLRGSMSIHELRNLVFALRDQNPQDIEGHIISYMEKFAGLYSDIQKGVSKKEIQSRLNIGKQHIPGYLRKWLGSKEYTNADYLKDIQNKLDYAQEYAEAYLADGGKKLKNARKFTKIREVLNFINRNIPKYLDQGQYEQMEILLGSLPKSKAELQHYLVEEDINAGCMTRKGFVSFNLMVKDSASLDKLLRKTLELTIEWCKNSKHLLEKNPTQEVMDGIAGPINVTRKSYDDDRIKFNVKQFLQDNISIPRGFIINLPFYEKDKEKTNITKRINDQVSDDAIGEYYSKVEDYKSDLKRYKKFGKEIDQIKTLDKMLLLLAGDYLEKKIIEESQALGLRISNNIRDVFKDEVAFERFNKLLTFGIKEFDKVSTVLEDRRLEKILKIYFPDDKEKIYFLDRKKYAERKQEKEEKENSETVNCDRKVFDIQDALQKVECEQLHVVDSVMKLEKAILMDIISKELSKERNDFLEKALDDLGKVDFPNDKSKELFKKKKAKLKGSIKEAVEDLVKGGNRIETKTLLEKANLKSKEKIIRENRNAAFHNDIPDGGFQLEKIAGIKV